MERGLIWLPLLIGFVWLAWAGWNEYQKVENYRVWAESFDNAKYDIYAVLGIKGKEITWGKPTRNGPKDLQSFSLENVTEINLRVNGETVSLDNPPSKGTPVIEFCRPSQGSIEIPFTQVELAAKWVNYLRKEEH
ncbi:hypothetical protein PN462_03035 [Spirulina sp. CS-785/01]|uniref:hypothetical protein n=1 Tax=Spirulina sp. CS-785/01 TaxID=3021716 RepID=UPI00232FE34C|nr:hypothetical protein [Spirulina sp. CS-785/01]MDB9312062.1 hypothetical protein [Spirulina sp. CS-785/01]